MGQLDRAQSKSQGRRRRSAQRREVSTTQGDSAAPQREDTHHPRAQERVLKEEFPRPQQTLVLSLAALWTVSPAASVPVSTEQSLVGSRHTCTLTLSVPA